MSASVGQLLRTADAIIFKFQKRLCAATIRDADGPDTDTRDDAAMPFQAAFFDSDNESDFGGF